MLSLKLKKILKINTLILFTCISLSCARVKIKDQVWYADIGPLGALEFHTLSDLTREISKPEWDKIRVGMIATSTGTFSENKEIILKLCTDNPRCTFEDKEQLENFFIKIEAVSSETRK